MTVFVTSHAMERWAERFGSEDITPVIEEAHIVPESMIATFANADLVMYSKQHCAAFLMMRTGEEKYAVVTVVKPPLKWCLAHAGRFVDRRKALET